MDRDVTRGVDLLTGRAPQPRPQRRPRRCPHLVPPLAALLYGPPQAHNGVGTMSTGTAGPAAAAHWDGYVASLDPLDSALC